MACTGEKITICDFGLSRSLGNQFSRHFESIINIEYFYVNFFRFTKKFPPLLTQQAFFQNIFTPAPLPQTHDDFS